MVIHTEVSIDVTDQPQYGRIYGDIVSIDITGEQLYSAINAGKPVIMATKITETYSGSDTIRSVVMTMTNTTESVTHPGTYSAGFTSMSVGGGDEEPSVFGDDVFLSFSNNNEIPTGQFSSCIYALQPKATNT